MWYLRWLAASLPAAAAALVIGAAPALAFGDGRTALVCGSATLALFWAAWFSLVFLPGRLTRRFWAATAEPLLERTWVRAFDEVGAEPPPAPVFLVSSEPVPIFLVCCSGFGTVIFLVSRAWLQSTSESEQRRAFREAAESLNLSGARLRTAHAWFTSLVLRYLPQGVRQALWISPGAAPSTVIQWMVALPWISWMLWTREALKALPCARVRAGERGVSLLPVDPARRAMTTLLSVEPALRIKSILSFDLPS